MNDHKRMVAIIAATAFGVSACAVSRPYGNPSAVVPAGAELEVQRTLKRPGNSRRIYVQAGERVTQDARDLYSPYCYFHLTPEETGQLPERVRPGTFVSEGAVERVRVSERDAREDTRVASLGALRVGQAAGGGGAGSYSYFEYATIIPLASDDQPGVDSLQCAQFADPNNPAVQHYLNVGDLRRTLEGIVELRLPEGAASESGDGY